MNRKQMEAHLELHGWGINVYGGAWLGVMTPAKALIVMGPYLPAGRGVPTWSDLTESDFAIVVRTMGASYEP